MNDDNRSLEDLASEVLAVQDACNLSGVVHSWSRSLSRLRHLLSGYSTKQINEHPINQLWADKVAHLSGTQGQDFSQLSKAFEAVRRTAKKEQ